MEMTICAALSLNFNTYYVIYLSLKYVNENNREIEPHIDI